ncbi:MAG: serine hydrolase domain-containing protein, partial [Solirubrobacterales bacterium]
MRSMSLLCSPLLLLPLLLFPSPAAGQATIGGEWREDVAAFAQRVVDLGLTPGVGIAVTQDDWVLWSGGFGVADAATGRKVDEATQFYIASSTKALTGTTVALRAARGEIDLDAPIDRYIPGLAFRAPMDAGQVTVERLLTMTDGLEDGGPVVIRTAYSGEFTPELLIELLAGYGPDEDGAGFSYDNLPYNILGLALDPANAEGWKDAVEAEVLEPLGMVETSARLSTLDPDRLAMPHAIVPGSGYRRIHLAKADANLHAAGGHFTTPRDLARFVAAHASGGRLEGVRVFPEAPITSTHEKHADQDRTFGPYKRFGWGYGWDLGTWEGKTIVHRFGSFPGYRSHMSFEPESRLGVVVLVNGDDPASPAADLLASYVYDRLLGRDDLEAAYERRLHELEAEAAESERETADHLAERARRLAPLAHPLAAYAGTYVSPTLGTMAWRVVAGGL